MGIKIQPMVVPSSGLKSLAGPKDVPIEALVPPPVYGASVSDPDVPGVLGEHLGGGAGVQGISSQGHGVEGASTENDGVIGISHATTSPKSGVFGQYIGPRQDCAGVTGQCDNGAGVIGRGTIGVIGQGKQLAGQFVGDVEVTGNVNCAGDVYLVNKDLAEDFTISGAGDIEPGTVMVIDAEGELRESQRPYDKRVAGVISGAGRYKAAIVLGRSEPREDRLPLALTGKVFCKVDADHGTIEVGDLLTSSPTRGHAMKADDPAKAFGAVIGKALMPLHAGRGLIPILVALQ